VTLHSLYIYFSWKRLFINGPKISKVLSFPEDHQLNSIASFGPSCPS
jgi:hypothetical protein